MAIAISLFSASTYRFSGLEVRASAGLSGRGMTEVIIPPLGSVGAHTHIGPLTYRIELRNIDPGQLKQWLDILTTQDISKPLEQEALLLLRRFLVRLLIVGGAGSLLMTFMVGLRRPSQLVAGLVAGVLVLTLTVSVSLGTYHSSAFQQPQFRGAIAAAPWMVGLAEESVSKVREFSDQMQVLSSNLYRYFESIQQLKALGDIESDRTVLIVSDIHNNPGAISMVSRVVETFSPDFIIDAGDITDYGTQFEYTGLKSLGNLDVPYILIPGNHDSPEVLDQLGQLPNVTVLSDRFAVVQGVRIYGVGDPSSRALSPAEPSQPEVDGAIEATKNAFQGQGNPFILVAHNPRIAGAFFGGTAPGVPVLISGHDHRIALNQQDGQVWIDPGTTGAAGLRGLMSSKEVPYSLVLLHLKRVADGEQLHDPGVAWQAVAIDTLKVFNLEGSFTIERKLLTP